MHFKMSSAKFRPFRSGLKMSSTWATSGKRGNRVPTMYMFRPNSRADSRLAPSEWETWLQSNAVSDWLGVNLESALQFPLKQKSRKITLYITSFLFEIFSEILYRARQSYSCWISLFSYCHALCKISQGFVDLYEYCGRTRLREIWV